MNRRAFLATTAAAAGVTMKAAYAATVAPFGQTGAPTRSTQPLPLGPLSGSRYPDSHLESLKKPPGSFGASGFPAFAGTMAVERVATGFRWAEGPVYFPAGRYVVFSDIPNNRIMRFFEDDGHVSVYRQPSMNSNGNTIDREGRLITCEHSGRRVTRTELDGSITIIADKYNGKKLNSPNDAVVAADGSIWFCDLPTVLAAITRASRPSPNRKRKTSTGWIRNPVTSRWSSMISWSRTAFASRLTRRGSISAIPASRTGRTTRRIFACSTWISGPESFRTARSLRKCPSPALPTGCAVTPPGAFGAPSVGAIPTRTACAATLQTAICSARSTYQKRSPTCVSAVSNEIDFTSAARHRSTQFTRVRRALCSHD